MKTLYGIIAGILFTAIAIGAYIGLCGKAKRATRITKLTNLFGSAVSGVKRYTVDLFKSSGPAEAPVAVDETIPMEA